MPSLAELGQAVINATLPFIITRILTFKDKKDNTNETELTSFNEDIKTLISLLNGVQDNQSKLFE